MTCTWRLLLLSLVGVFVVTPEARGAERSTLSLGTDWAEMGWQFEDRFFADCISTEAPLTLHRLAWSTDHSDANAEFTWPARFTIGELGADGTFVTIWSQSADRLGQSRLQEVADIEVDLRGAGEYCVAIQPAGGEPEGQALAFAATHASATVEGLGAEYEVRQTEACWGLVAELELGYAACDYLTDEAYRLDLEFSLLDEDGDGDPAVSDCDDQDPAVAGTQAEVCNHIDDNCDGQVDEGVGDGWYADLDGDGYGGSRSVDCRLGDAVRNDDDCDDDDAAVNPAAIEHCNGVDDDCSGGVDDDVIEVEECNGVDDDCDGETDEDPVDGELWYEDHDGDGIGDPEAFVEACAWPGIGYTQQGHDCDDADIFRAQDCSPPPDCDAGCGSGSGGFTLTVCEVSTALVGLPALLAVRRRRWRQGPAGPPPAPPAAR